MNSLRDSYIPFSHIVDIYLIDYAVDRIAIGCIRDVHYGGQLIKHDSSGNTAALWMTAADREPLTRGDTFSLFS